MTISKENYEKVEEMAKRYGITVNSFMAFIIGQWIDQNYETQNAMSEMVNQFLSSPDDLFKNPQLFEMVKEILKEDQEFKNMAFDKLD